MEEVLKLILIFPAVFVAIMILGFVVDNMKHIKGATGEVMGYLLTFIYGWLLILKSMLFVFISIVSPLILWHVFIEPLDEMSSPWIEPVASVFGAVLFIVTFRWLCRRYGCFDSLF